MGWLVFVLGFSFIIKDMEGYWPVGGIGSHGHQRQIS